jgi:hypothetical protein
MDSRFRLETLRFLGVNNKRCIDTHHVSGHVISSFIRHDNFYRLRDHYLQALSEHKEAGKGRRTQVHFGEKR